MAQWGATHSALKTTTGWGSAAILTTVRTGVVEVVDLMIEVSINVTPHTVRAEPVEASACLGEPFDGLRANGGRELSKPQ
jgi:hypothetical protein